MKKVTAIFDIGKTNKKFILFDNKLNEVYKDYIQIEEIQDEDGYPCDDLLKITKWIVSCITKSYNGEKYQIEKINFSTYGASLVHIDKDGNPLTRLYNYTKQIDDAYIDKLYSNYGGINKLSSDTASPPSGMLNSGVQLYWLKYHKPEIYSKVKYSLHLPQFLSFFITGQPISEYTSIGCHTMMWDYQNEKYHQWIQDEEIDNKFAPIVKTDSQYTIDYNGHNITIGTGVHDSSAALIPYLIGEQDPFVLISTGTWNVTLNPFYKKHEQNNQIAKETLNYMTKDGSPVKASRVFLGNEYKLQVERLTSYFNEKEDAHTNILLNQSIYIEILKKNKKHFRFTSIISDQQESTQQDLSSFPSFEFAYHQLMHELILIQIKNTKSTISNTSIKKIYIDGGFIDNDIFIKLITYYFSDYKILTATSPIGSAIGAALLVNNIKNASELLISQFKIKKHKTLIIDTAQNEKN